MIEYQSLSAVMAAAVRSIPQDNSCIMLAMTEIFGPGKSSITLRLVRSQWTHELVMDPLAICLPCSDQSPLLDTTPPSVSLLL